MAWHCKAGYEKNTMCDTLKPNYNNSRGLCRLQHLLLVSEDFLHHPGENLQITVTDLAAIAKTQ